MTGWRRVLRGVVMIALVVVLYFVVPVEVRDEDIVYRVILSMLVVGLLTAGVIWQVILHVEDPNRRVDGLVLGLLFAVLAFALGFYKLNLEDPGQIDGLVTRLDSLYFTVSTLLTVGFGDIHAEGQIARAMVLVAMVFNVAVIATAAATLTSRVRLHAEALAEARRAAQESGSAPQKRIRHPRRTHRNPR